MAARSRVKFSKPVWRANYPRACDTRRHTHSPESPRAEQLTTAPPSTMRSCQVLACPAAGLGPGLQLTNQLSHSRTPTIRNTDLNNYRHNYVIRGSLQTLKSLL